MADIPSSLYYLNLLRLWQWRLPSILSFLRLMHLHSWHRDLERTRFQGNTYSYAQLSSWWKITSLLPCSFLVLFLCIFRLLSTIVVLLGHGLLVLWFLSLCMQVFASIFLANDFGLLSRKLVCIIPCWDNNLWLIQDTNTKHVYTYLCIYFQVLSLIAD